MGLMNLITRRRASAKAETRAQLPDFYRQLDGGLRLLAAYGTADAGVPVTPETALRAAAVSACVGRISRDIATLPRRIIDRKTKGPANHPANRLLNHPNDYMTGAQFWQALAVNLLLYGNAYASLDTPPGRVTPAAMLPLMSRSTQPRRVNGMLVYDTGATARITLRPDQVAHVPLLTLDGVCGVSPIQTASATIGTGIALDEFAARYFGQGAMLSQNAFELPPMSPDAIKESRRLLQEEYGGVANAHKLLAAPGLKVHRLSHSMKESQAIEARDWQMGEVCRLYGVPIGIIDASKSKYAGLEAQYRDYAEATLRPLAVQIEEEFTRKLLPDRDQGRYAVRFNLDAIVRASLTDRMEADAKGVQAGILTPNEARQHHDLPAVQGGDTLLSPLNMTPAQGRSTPAPGSPEQSGELGHVGILQGMAESIARSIAVREAKSGPAAANKPGGLEQWAKEHERHLAYRLPFLPASRIADIAEEARSAFAEARDAGTVADTAKAWPSIRIQALAAAILNPKLLTPTPHPPLQGGRGMN